MVCVHSVERVNHCCVSKGFALLLTMWDWLDLGGGTEPLQAVALNRANVRYQRKTANPPK
jgi:hypothetical protein